MGYHRDELDRRQEHRFEDEAGAEDQTDIPATGELGNDVGLLEDIDIDQEADPDNYGAG